MGFGGGPEFGTSQTNTTRMPQGIGCTNATCRAKSSLASTAGPDWVHEIKHDGYRMQVRRDGDTVRLFTRRGYDWTDRYPAIVTTAVKLRASSFTLYGEACVCGPDGVAIFDALHRHGTVSEAMLYAFDLLELDGEDLRALPLAERKKRLARLVGKRRLGIVPPRTAPRSSSRRAGWAVRASCRSGSPRPTGQGRRGIGSR
jgi:bifunctional non-homologous end joining protein LigD